MSFYSIVARIRTILTSRPKYHPVIRTKWVFRNKPNNTKIVVRTNPS